MIIRDGIGNIYLSKLDNSISQSVDTNLIISNIGYGNEAIDTNIYELISESEKTYILNLEDFFTVYSDLSNSIPVLGNWDTHQYLVSQSIYHCFSNKIVSASYNSYYPLTEKLEQVIIDSGSLVSEINGLNSQRDGLVSALTSIVDLLNKNDKNPIILTYPDLVFNKSRLSSSFTIKNITNNEINWNIKDYDDRPVWLTKINPISGELDSIGTVDSFGNIASMTSSVIDIDISKLTDIETYTLNIATDDPNIISSIKISVDKIGALLEVEEVYHDFSSTEDIWYFDIVNSGDNILTYKIVTDQSWVNIAPVGGEIKIDGTQKIGVNVIRDDLPHGTFISLINLKETNEEKNISEKTISISVDVITELSVINKNIDFGKNSKIVVEDNITNLGQGKLRYGYNIGNTSGMYPWITKVIPEKTELKTNEVSDITFQIDRSQIEHGNQSGSIEIYSIDNYEDKETINISAEITTSMKIDPIWLDFKVDETSNFTNISNIGEGLLVWQIDHFGEESLITSSLPTKDEKFYGNGIATFEINRDNLPYSDTSITTYAGIKSDGNEIGKVYINIYPDWSTNRLTYPFSDNENWDKWYNESGSDAIGTSWISEIPSGWLTTKYLLSEKYPSIKVERKDNIAILTEIGTSLSLEGCLYLDILDQILSVNKTIHKITGHIKTKTSNNILIKIGNYDPYLNHLSTRTIQDADSWDWVYDFTITPVIIKDIIPIYDEDFSFEFEAKGDRFGIVFIVAHDQSYEISNIRVYQKWQ